MRRIVIISVMFLNLAKIQAQTGTIESITFQAPSLAGNLLGTSTTQPMAVYLPAEYATSAKHYPVVYFLPGYGDHVSDWVTGYLNLKSIMDRLIANKTVPEVIVVIVSGWNQLQGSFYSNSPVTGNWEDYVVQDVVGYVDESYRTIPKLQSRGIVGQSMGGYGALTIAMHHPEVSGSVYALSPGLFDTTGLKTSQLFKSESFIRQYLQKDSAFAAFTPASGLQANYLIYIGGRLAAGDWDTPFIYAYGSAFSPDLQQSRYPYIAYPYSFENQTLKCDSAVLKNYESGFGNVREKISQYSANLRNLAGITIDYGTYDEYAWIPKGCKYFSDLLTESGIAHRVFTFPGGHMNMVAARFEQSMLPVIMETVQSAESPSSIESNGRCGGNSSVNIRSYPNPVRLSETTIFEISSERTGLADIRIYDLLGRLVETIYHGSVSPTPVNIRWKHSTITSGVYFCTITVDGKRNSKQLCVLH